MEFSSHLLQNCWFLAGPTASGKSATALALAEALDGEIISLDSMAIYRSMDIGTAKPSLEERRRIPHHLVDVADPLFGDTKANTFLPGEAPRTIRVWAWRGRPRPTSRPQLAFDLGTAWVKVQDGA